MGKRSKITVDTAKLEHFLDFITSNQVIKDLPLGEKTLTLSTGEIIQTPYVIICLAPATIEERSVSAIQVVRHMFCVPKTKTELE